MHQDDRQTAQDDLQATLAYRQVCTTDFFRFILCLLQTHLAKASLTYRQVCTTHFFRFMLCLLQTQLAKASLMYRQVCKADFFRFMLCLLQTQHAKASLTYHQVCTTDFFVHVVFALKGTAGGLSYKTSSEIFAQHVHLDRMHTKMKALPFLLVIFSTRQTLRYLCNMCT